MAKPHNLLDTVEQAETAFYEALGRADIEALMSLWADEEDIVCIHPGAQRSVGHAAIRASWESIFERGGVLVRPVKLRSTQNPMVAIRNVVEELSAGSDKRQAVHVLATNVFMHTPQGWRIVVHHASIAPGSTGAEHGTPATLH